MRGKKDMSLPKIARQRKRKGVVLPPVRPSIGLEVIMRQKLQALIAEMHKSVTFWIEQQYRANAPAIAQDELPAASLQRAMRKVSSRWEDRFDEAAPELAEYFSEQIGSRSDAALRSILRKGGFSVKFKMTRAQRDVMKATVEQQVGLIKSIPQKYLNDVQGAVMRSVQAGRDLSQLSKEIENAYGVSKRRAALIARDQNNKATASMTRARQTELGITHAIWMHSHGGKKPRPKHLKANGKKYDVKKGLPIGDKGQYVFPGEEINCRCVSRSIIPGFDD